MNGIHDMGGMDGFGPVQRETNEPVFHEPWEGRVFGMSISGVGRPPSTIDARRHRIERLDPARYLASSYYERWLARMEEAIVAGGALSRDEIEAKIKEFSANRDLPVPRREDPAATEQISVLLRTGNPVTRTIRRKPRFAVGDRVMTRNLNPHGHTRLPRYTRGKHGVITAHHGAHVFPDTNAHGLGENPQHLYTVRISARELWGDTAETNECVLINLWESYLANDSSGTKPSAPRSLAKAKNAKSKASSRSHESSRVQSKSIRKKPR